MVGGCRHVCSSGLQSDGKLAVLGALLLGAVQLDAQHINLLHEADHVDSELVAQGPTASPTGHHRVLNHRRSNKNGAPARAPQQAPHTYKHVSCHYNWFHERLVFGGCGSHVIKEP